MKDFLQGRLIKHPLHPFLVHLPIAFFVLSFLLDVASLIWQYDGLVAGAFYSMAGGIITALLAAVPGFVDYTDIRDDHPAKKIATTHMALNLLAVAVYAVALGLRYPEMNAMQVPRVPFILSCVGILLLSVSGYLGGVMVYDHGIGVGRHRRRTRIPERTIKISRVGKEPLVSVTDADSLNHGETLRVEIDRTVLVLAKWEGQFYAFQEFCTHRFGPLSEGDFHDGQVECPWHRSCFDIRTGKAVRGPASVDLKTFPVEVRDGKVWVRLGPDEARKEEQAPIYIKGREPKPRPPTEKKIRQEDRHSP